MCYLISWFLRCFGVGLAAKDEGFYFYWEKDEGLHQQCIPHVQKRIMNRLTMLLLLFPLLICHLCSYSSSRHWFAASTCASGTTAMLEWFVHLVDFPHIGMIYQLFLTATLSDVSIPTCYSQAVKDVCWIKTMQDELQALQKNHMRYCLLPSLYIFNADECIMWN